MIVRHLVVRDFVELIDLLFPETTTPQTQMGLFSDGTTPEKVERRLGGNEETRAGPHGRPRETSRRDE